MVFKKKKFEPVVVMSFELSEMADWFQIEFSYFCVCVCVYFKFLEGEAVKLYSHENNNWEAAAVKELKSFFC